MNCTATRIITTFSSSGIDVAVLSYTQHSLFGQCTDHHAVGATGADISKEQYQALYRAFHYGNFNAVRKYGESVECDEDHVWEGGVDLFAAV